MPSYNTYLKQMSVLDNDDDIQWITVKGNHIPIKKGQSKGQALREFFESKKKNGGGAKKKQETKSTQVDPDDLSNEMLNESDYTNVGKMIVEIYNDGKKVEKRFVDNWLDDGEIWDDVARKSVHESVQKYMEEKYPSKEQKCQKMMEGIKNGANDLQSELKILFRRGSLRDFGFGGFSGWFGNLEEEGDTIRFTVRDLGDWEVSDSDRYDPDYADEDFSDWDWKVPTKETTKKVDEAIASVMKKYKDIDITVSYEEKNYMAFTLEKKGKKK